MQTILSVTIEALSPLGAGIAKDSTNKITFVPFTMPGDKVEARILEQHKRYQFAELIRVIEPSALRVLPECPWFGKCGGCQWQHVPYTYQWDTKVQGVWHALQRIGLDMQHIFDIQAQPSCNLSHFVQNHKVKLYPAPRPYGYRNRIQVRGVQEVDSDIHIGFYAAQSHDVVAIDHCAIAHANINEVLSTLTQKAEQDGISYPFKAEIMADLDAPVVWNQRHASSGFTQVYPEQNANLLSWIQSVVIQTPTDTSPLWDLYGGSGNFSRALKKHFASSHCVDAVITHADDPDIVWHKASIGSWARRQLKTPALASPWVILDPPRKGMGEDRGALKILFEHHRVKHLVHVGCDREAFSHDIKFWIDQGYQLMDLAIFDFFPQTPHVEIAAYCVKSADLPL